MPRRNAGPKSADAETRARLLRAATELFAAGGYHGTTVRDIAARAKANVAATHYHFGSKHELYIAVLRDRFALVRAQMDRAGGRLGDAEIATRTRAELEAIFHARITVILEFTVGPPGALHAQLMLREMLDPSEALPIIVAEFLEPIMVREMSTLVARLAPTLDADSLLRSVASISAQALFYRSTRPASLRIFKARSWSPAFLRVLAEHITQFSLGGVARLEARARGGSGAR